MPETPEQSEYLMFGGQAIPEGVMMRSPHYFSVACRAPNGKIVLHTEPLEKTWIGRQKWLKLPFLRGTFAILDGMTLGIRAMRFAGDVQILEKYQPPTTDAAGDDAKTGEAVSEASGGQQSEALGKAGVMLALVIGLALGIAMFNVLPNFLAQLAGKSINDSRGTLTNYIAEFVKIFLFLGYLWLISRMDAIKEVFRYHGAEHKAINTWEAGQPLTMANCLAQTRLHPRCGTSFAVIVFLVGFLFFPIVPRYPYGHPTHVIVDALTRIGIELCLLPLVAGVSYELLRLAGKMRNQKWVNLAFSPGLASQKYLTVLEPEPKHVEVALASLDAVVHAERTNELRVTDDFKPEHEASVAASTA